ncbi:MAG: type IV pilus secretin PilQ, partial [Alphaproteobacteria bacterium]
REERPRSTPAPSRPAPRRYSGRKVSLEFKDADILNVLRVIADVSQKNIVATDDVAGRVTIVLRDVPWDQALDILLRSTGLEKVEYDDVITVSTAKRIEEERRSRLAAQIAGRELETLRTEYIRVNYVKASDLALVLRGQSITGTPGSGLNQSGQTQAQNDMTVQAEAAAGQFRGLLSNRGSVQVNDVTNTLIIRDISEGIANARELVSKLDVQTPQVAIQGLIFEADTSTEVDLGIRWGASYKAGPGTGNPTGSNFPGRVGIGGAGPNTGVDGSPIMVDFPAGGVEPGRGSTLNLLLGSLSGAETIDAQITALEQAGKGKVISRPKVITLNNSEASIERLEIIYVRLPSTGTVINTGQNGSAGSNSVATQPIDTGIILKVRPQVSADGYVLMDLFVKSSVPSEQKTDDIPNEISRQASSQVLVREGETVVIGGVYRQRAANAMTGVPWLARIPVIGWLFKTTRDFDNRQELLVFITPRVVWRPAAPGALPSASELWTNRAATAYPQGMDVTTSPGAAGPRW